MSEKEAFTIGHIDSFEKTGNWSLVRRSLGISSFGINRVVMPPGGSIPEHTEEGSNGSPDQEELFIVLDGEPTVVIDGADNKLKEGSYVRLDPALKRYIKNEGDKAATILVISAPTTSGYRPPSWA